MRGLFTGYLPTLMEDVPDMAFKFASYETLRNLHRQVFSRPATAQVNSSTLLFSYQLKCKSFESPLIALEQALVARMLDDQG